MKSLQKLIALGLMIFFSINLATAQDGDKNRTPETRAQKQTERLTKKLSLNETQVTQIAAINLEYANKMAALKSDSADKEANKTAKKSLRTEQSSAIKALLTPEQVEKYNEKGDRKRGGKKGGKGKSANAERSKNMGTPQERATRQTERMTEQLSLTPAQADQIAAIHLSYAEKMATAKSASTDKEANKEAHRAMRTEQSNAIKALLTPEQLTKYNEKGKRKRGGKKGRDSDTEQQ